MNWDMIGALGEIVGAAAVVASLVFLTSQVALSNRLAKAEAWRSRISELTSLNASFGIDPRFHRAMVRVFGGCTAADLNEDEVSLVTSYVISSATIYEQLFREVRDGILDPRALEEYPGRIVFGLPFFRAEWPLIKSTLSAPFAQFAEGRHDLAATLEADAGLSAGATS
jgi:hypothetical protein